VCHQAKLIQAGIDAAASPELPHALDRAAPRLNSDFLAHQAAFDGLDDWRAEDGMGSSPTYFHVSAPSKSRMRNQPSWVGSNIRTFTSISRCGLPAAG
jgi:hypothetical protein